MSNHLTSEVYKRRIGSLSRNAVLVLMADKASDDGSGIWASKQRMADELGCSKQTVIDVIKSLMADGLVREVGQRQNANGYTVEYLIDVAALLALPLVPHHQSSSLTGQKSAPVKSADPTSQAALPHQSSSLTQTPLNHPEPPLVGRAGAPPATSPAGNEGDQDQGEAPAAGAAGGKKALHQPPNKPLWAAHVLPDDWVPPAVADLPTATSAMVRQWPAGAYAQAADNFRDHWSVVDRKRRTPAGHAAAFRNWLGRLHPEMIRAAKAGVSFAAPAGAAGGAGVHRAPPGPVAAKAIEDERSQAIHARLRATLGNAIWQQWFAPAAMLVGKDGQAITVVAPSAFHRDWIERCFAAPLSQAARAVLGADAGPVCLEVADQAGAAEPAADRLPNGKITSSEQGERQHG